MLIDNHVVLNARIVSFFFIKDIKNKSCVSGDFDKHTRNEDKNTPRTAQQFMDHTKM